jgi:hypothetical protein
MITNKKEKVYIFNKKTNFLIHAFFPLLIKACFFNEDHFF